MDDFETNPVGTLKRLKGIKAERDIFARDWGECARKIGGLEEERDALAARVAELEQWQRDMVAKAAEGSLAGYRELGQLAAKAEDERDAYRTQYLSEQEMRQTMQDEVNRIEAERDALAADAARYGYLVQAGAFRILQPDMGGNHTWFGVGRSIGKGSTIEEAIDAEIARREENDDGS